MNANMSMVLRKHSVGKILLPLFTALSFIIIVTVAIKGLPGDDISRDMLVADFRTDVNMLTEALKIIESKRIENPDSGLNAFGTTGKLLGYGEMNQNLKQVLIKISHTDTGAPDDALTALGIMGLNTELYSAELKNCQYYDLTFDNNLMHYVVITKGNYAGTVLYNGSMQSIDSQKRRFFGIELFDLVID